MYCTRGDIYLARDGRAVRRGDPAAMTLLFPANLDIPERTARRYGLAALEGAEAGADVPFSDDIEEKAYSAPPATKARTGPQTTKRRAQARRPDGKGNAHAT